MSPGFRTRELARCFRTAPEGVRGPPSRSSRRGQLEARLAAVGQFVGTKGKFNGRLRWKEDAARLTPVNASIFHVHAFFICLILVIMGLPCVLDPAVFIEPTRAGGWLAWSFSGFWAIRLYFQWFVYPHDLWWGKPRETLLPVGSRKLFAFILRRVV